VRLDLIPKTHQQKREDPALLVTSMRSVLHAGFLVLSMGSRSAGGPNPPALEQHYTSSNQHKPARTNMKYMLDLSAGTSHFRRTMPFWTVFIVKGLVYPKMKILTLMLFQPLKTFVHLRNTN